MTSNKKGFTLIELLVVIAIIGLLSTISILALNSARARSRDARRVSDISQIRNALEMYYNAANQYPSSSPLTSIVHSSGEVFLQAVPKAPTPADSAVCKDTNEYKYTPSEDNTSYTLTFCLGSNTGTIPAGVNTSTPSGISASTTP